MCELTYIWEGHLVCFNSKESNGRATEGVMTTIVYSMMICVQFHDNDITHSENYFCAQCNEYFVWVFLSTYQGDSGGVLMMQEKSGSGRWIQVFLIRRLFIEAPSENLHFWQLVMKSIGGPVIVCKLYHGLKLSCSTLILRLEFTPT